MVDINNLPLTVETSHFIQCAIFFRLLKCLSGDWEALRAQYEAYHASFMARAAAT